MKQESMKQENIKQESMKEEELIYRKHPEPKHHKRMSVEERAAQFSAFAALSGYEEAIRDTARKTEEFVRKNHNV